VNQLRRKLADADPSRDGVHIRTEPGVGYRLTFT
jgi:DNA-binding response OmpR family regulator